MSINLPAIDDTLWIIDEKYDGQMKYAGMTFKVVEHKRTNVVIAAQGMSIPGVAATRLRVKPHQIKQAPADANTVAATTPTFLPPLAVGTVFTVDARTLNGANADDLLVVIGHTGIAHKATLLGGDQDRYWRSVARAAMHPVDTTKLLDSLKSLLAG